MVSAALQEGELSLVLGGESFDFIGVRNAREIVAAFHPRLTNTCNAERSELVDGIALKTERARAIRSLALVGAPRLAFA